MGVRDRIRSQLWYNSIGGDQIEIWWVFQTGSEVNCGIIAWAVTKSKYDGCSRPDQKSIVVKQPGRRPNRDKMTANNIHLRVACNEKMLKKHWMKKATRWLKMIVHLCIDLRCATFWEYAMGDKDKYSTNGHIIYAMVHPSVFNTDWNEMGHISKSNGVRERWIFIIKSIHRCATCQLFIPVSYTHLTLPTKRIV